MHSTGTPASTVTMFRLAIPVIIPVLYFAGELIRDGSSYSLCAPIRRMEVVDFPVTVVIDTLGQNLYEAGQKAYLASLT